jgi:purine-binding chemotaxis protein CheW
VQRDRDDASVAAGDDHLDEYVTALVSGQLFGLPIQRVQDVFKPERVTRVPLAPPEIAGVLNLRGRIVTLIDLRRRLGFGEAAGEDERMAIGVDTRGESYGLLIDSIGEVLRLGAETREPNPLNLEPALARVSAGIHRLDGELLVVLDVDRVLEVGVGAIAA